MKMARRIFIALSLLIPALALTWLGVTESGLRSAFQIAKPYLPGALTIKNIEGRLIGPITLSDINYQHNDTVIKAGQVILEWQPAALLAANINIDSLQIRALSIVLPQTGKTESAQTQSIRLPEIHLPWRVSLHGLVIDGLNVSQNDQHYNAQQIRLSASSLFNNIDIDQLSISADSFNLNIKGTLQSTHNYRHQLEVDWQATLPSTAVIKSQGQISGDLQQTRIHQQLSGPLQLTLDGTVNHLLEQLEWQANVDVVAIDAAKLNTAWPAITGKSTLSGNGNLTTATMSGTVEGYYPELGSFDGNFKVHRLTDNSIQIERLMLHTPVSETRIDGRGQWRPGDNGGDLAVGLHWQNLRWPLKDGAWFNSSIGSGWVEGNLDHYRLGLASDRPWPEAPPSVWYASADGDLKGLGFHSLRVTTLDGEAVARGQLGWSPRLTWQAAVTATKINPGALWPTWPGQLNATLTSTGRLENGQLRSTADITQLTGKLRGYPVSLDSHLDWRDNGLDITRLDFHSGGSQVNAHGRVAESLMLDWSVNATDLAELYPGAGGQLQAQGQLGGPLTAPTLHASLKGQALSLEDYQIGRLIASLTMDWQRWQQLDLDLSAEALELKGYHLQSLAISGGPEHIAVHAVTDALTVVLELKGTADTQGWNGQIERADLNSQQFHDWRLESPTSLSLDSDNMSLAPLCWQSGDSKLCIAGQRKGINGRATLQAVQIPLTLLTPWLPSELKLEGLADADADILYQSETITGKANISLPSGAVSYPLLEGEHNRWEYTGGKVNIALNDQGISAQSELAISNVDHFQARLELPGTKLLTIKDQQPLRGEAQLTVHDLGLIEAFLPEVQNLQGEVTLNLDATGTLARPLFSGHAQLLNGSLQIPRLGLSIDQIGLQAQSDALEKLNFHLDAHSGEGQLNVAGQTVLDQTAGWPTTITIKGDSFEVSRIPEAQVQVSPDLRINLKQRTIHIEGDVNVPYARLQPKDITTAARVSADTVIVGGEQPAAETWNIFTQVRLILGDRVQFYGFGFEGRFGGSLLLHDEPGQLTTATGELNVLEGRYRAYGQRLDVEQGRLLFTGGPVTNPGLDIRSVRHIGDVTAGLKVWGSINQPQIELFSIPAMDQTDALAYLMLGRPIENASGEEGAMMAKATLALGLSGGDSIVRQLGDRFGMDEMRIESSDTGDQASLVMGRYLSPKLYVSYGVGLIESFNTFSVRYQISNKWQIKAESGESQGADLFYTIER